MASKYEIEQSLKKKIKAAGMSDNRSTVVYRSDPEKTLEHEPTEAERMQAEAREGIRKKLGFLSGEDVKPLGSKYMGKPISEIMAAQKRCKEAVEAAESELDTFLDGEYQKVYKACKKAAVLDPEVYARDYVEKSIIGNNYQGDKEAKAAHKEYEKLRYAVRMATAEQNAVELAKQAYIDNNPYIAEERKKREIEDLKKSGLLEEMGLSEKATKQGVSNNEENIEED